MFVSPAFAQAPGGAGSGLEAILPLVLIFIVFYFLLIRPQQKKMKQHRETLAAIRRGDKVVTGGGIIGIVSKVDDEDQVTVEIAQDIKVKVRRDLISTVLLKPQPASSNIGGQTAAKGSSGLFSGIFGGNTNKVEQKADDKDDPSIAENKVSKRARAPRKSGKDRKKPKK